MITEEIFSGSWLAIKSAPVLRYVSIRFMDGEITKSTDALKAMFVQV